MHQPYQLDLFDGSASVSPAPRRYWAEIPVYGSQELVVALVQSVEHVASILLTCGMSDALAYALNAWQRGDDRALNAFDVHWLEPV